MTKPLYLLLYYKKKKKIYEVKKASLVISEELLHPIPVRLELPGQYY